MSANYEITKADIKSLRVAFTRAETSTITSLDFSYSGEFLVITCKEILRIYELEEEKVDEIFAKSYDAKVAKFYDGQHFLYTSLKDNEIRLVNFESGSKKKFKGHTDEVVSFSVTPTFFFTGSKDKTVRKWDPRTPKEVSCLNLPDVPFVTNFDDKLAVAYNSSIIEIYDVKDLQKHLHRSQYKKRAEWTGIQFSPDGKMLMITTDSTYILVVDSKTGEEMSELSGFKNPKGIHLDAVFSCDSKYLFGGTVKGRLQVWDLKYSAPLCSLKSGYNGPYERVAFNPEYMNVASTSSSTVGTKSNALHLWIEKY